jgi:hypothetical protein
MPENIILGAHDCQTADWLEAYYPDDLPQDWRLDYYANDYPLICLSEQQWLTQGDTDYPEHLLVYVEVTEMLLNGSAHTISSLAPVRALLTRDEKVQIQLEKIGVKSRVALLKSLMNGWWADLDEGRLVSLKPKLPLDLRALRSEIEFYYRQASGSKGYLFLDTPPGTLEQCRTLLNLLCLT